MADEIIEEEFDATAGISIVAINNRDLSLAVGDIGAQNIITVVKSPTVPGVSIVIVNDPTGALSDGGFTPVRPPVPWPPIHVD